MTAARGGSAWRQQAGSGNSNSAWRRRADQAGGAMVLAVQEGKGMVAPPASTLARARGGVQRTRRVAWALCEIELELAQYKSLKMFE